MDLNINQWHNLSYSKKLSYLEATPTDCSFLIGSGANAKTISAHKSILVRSSTVFKSMFNGNYKEADSTVNIPLLNVVEYSDFEAILEYIYYKKTDAIKHLSMERLKHIAYLADYFILDELRYECHNKIERKLVEKHTSFYDYLQVFEYAKKLGKNIGTFLYDNRQHEYSSIPYTSTEILAVVSIYDLEPQYFYELLKRLFSKVKEHERFLLIEIYAKIHGLQMEDFAFKNIQNSINFVGDVKSATTNRGKTLAEMFQLIDFNKMTINEFKYGPAVSKVWTVSSEKKLGIMFNLKQ